MITMAQQLEASLWGGSELMQNLQPRLVLVGSTQEGSRLGIGNEIDLTMHFKGWKKPFKIKDDAFHLRKADKCPMWMYPLGRGVCARPEGSRRARHCRPVGSSKV